jgi:ATP-dependent protease ClpP protease subunit
MSEAEEEPQEFFSIKKTRIAGHIYDFYFFDQPIHNRLDLSDMLDSFRYASEDDRINIYLNNPGGCVHTTIQILNAMNDCKASITAIADGHVASAATFIFLAADVQKINKHSSFLFHCCHIESDTGTDKLPDMIKHEAFSKRSCEPLWVEYYSGFFTEKELESMIEEGKDFRLTDSEAEKRLARRIKYLKKVS